MHFEMTKNKRLSSIVDKQTTTVHYYRKKIKRFCTIKNSLRRIIYTQSRRRSDVFCDARF